MKYRRIYDRYLVLGEELVPEQCVIEDLGTFGNNRLEILEQLLDECLNAVFEWQPSGRSHRCPFLWGFDYFNTFQKLSRNFVELFYFFRR